MSDLAFTGVTIPDISETFGNTSAATIDADGEKAAMIITAPKTGNIAKVRFTTGTVTTGDDIKLSIQTPDASGDPDGTILGTGNSAYGTQTVGDADDNTSFWVTLSSALSVTVGQFLAIVIEYDSYGSGDMQIRHSTGTYELRSNFPYADVYTASWAKTQGGVITSLQYDDGSYAPHPRCLPLYLSGSNSTDVAYNTGDDPDEYGNRFSVPVETQAVGWWASHYNASGADYQIKLYSKTTSDCDTVQTQAVDGDYSVSLQYPVMGLFDAPVTLVTGATHRITKDAASGTDVRLNLCTVSEAAEMAALSWGTSCYGTQKSDAGAWTDSTTTRYMIGIIIDQITTSASGGGLLLHPGMDGGFRA